MARITAANAREMAALSHKKRRQRETVREDETTSPHPTPQETTTDPDYVKGRLARVRKQLDRVDRMMMKEEDAQQLDRLANAQRRLAEQRANLGRAALSLGRVNQVPNARRKRTFAPVE